METVKVPIWQKTWFVVLACIFVPPAGITLLWVGKKGGMALRIVLTVFLGFYSLGWLSALFGGSSESTIAEEEPAQVTEEKVEAVEEVKPEPEPQPEKDPAVVEAEYKAASSAVSYDELARYPENYEYQQIVFTGEVAQVIEDGNARQYRIAVDDNYDQMIYVDYSGGSLDGRILEDDYVTFWGISTGLLSYESTMGGTITIPSFVGIYHQIN